MKGLEDVNLAFFSLWSTCFFKDSLWTRKAVKPFCRFHSWESFWDELWNLQHWKVTACQSNDDEAGLTPSRVCFSTAYKCRCTRKGPKIRYKDVQKLEIKPKHPFCQEKMILWVIVFFSVNLSFNLSPSSHWLSFLSVSIFVFLTSFLCLLSLPISLFNHPIPSHFYTYFPESFHLLRPLSISPSVSCFSLRFFPNYLFFHLHFILFAFILSSPMCF